MAPPAICLLLFSSDGLYLLLLASFLFLPQLNFCTLLLGAFVVFFSSSHNYGNKNICFKLSCLRCDKDGSQSNVHGFTDSHE